MDFGELLAGAGRIGRGAREEAQRLRDYERDRTALAEMRRMEAMRESLARGGVPETPPEMLRFGPEYPFYEVPEVGPAPAAPIAPATPAAPIAPATPAAPTTVAPAAAAPTPTTAESVPVTVRPLKQEPPIVREELATYKQLQQLQSELATAKARIRAESPTGSPLMGHGIGAAQTPAQRQQARERVKFLEQRIAEVAKALSPDQINLEKARDRLRVLEAGGMLSADERQEVATLKKTITDLEKRVGPAPRLTRRKQTGLDVGAPTPTAAPVPQIDNARMSDIMEHFESRGNPEAVSGAGAIGLMQVKPETAMKPGVSGVESIFDIALTVANNPYNVADNKRTKEEAARLLRIPELNKAFGSEYFKGLLAKYGNVEHALVAYNWGLTNANKWVAKGADPTKLPAETRKYVANIQGAYGRTDFIPSTFAKRALGVTAPAVVVTGSQGAEPADTRGITPAAAAAPVAAPQRVEPSAFRAQENATPEALRQYQQQRAELVRLAKMYQQAGMGAEVQQLRGQIIGMDNDFLRMQGMQGLQEFAYGDPRRLSAVWSAYAGTSVGIQPRSDGMFNLFVGGQRYGEAMSLKQLTDQARRSFDSAYQQRMAEIEAMTYEEGVKSSLRMAEERDKQVATMIKDIYIERAKGNQQQALEMIKQQGFNVQMSNDGSGRFVVQRGGQAYMVDPKAMKPTGPEGMAVEVPVFPIKLPGLR